MALTHPSEFPAIASIEFDPAKSYLLLVDREQVPQKALIEGLMDLPTEPNVCVVPMARTGEGEPVVSMDNLRLIRQWLEEQEAMVLP